MHDILEAHCLACGFSLRGLSGPSKSPTCTLCGFPLTLRSNLAVTRPLPRGLGVLMGAFAASLDASPLLARENRPVPGFARRA